ncbi:MAG: hypothetical protein KIT39_04400 [Nitrospirales bacterium]|nr:hypothetical protein [Nitrospirales bacterium]
MSRKKYFFYLYSYAKKPTPLPVGGIKKSLYNAQNRGNLLISFLFLRKSRDARQYSPGYSQNLGMKNFPHGLHFADPKNQSLLCDGCHSRGAKEMMVQIISKLFPSSFVSNFYTNP